MSTYSQYQTDSALETDGVIFDLGEAGEFRIARAGGGNKRFTSRLETAMKPYRQQVRNNNLKNDVAERILSEVYAETIVLGWENVTGPDGEPLPFSIQNCKKLFADLPDLFREIREMAENAAAFRATELEADAGN